MDIRAQVGEPEEQLHSIGGHRESGSLSSPAAPAQAATSYRKHFQQNMEVVTNQAEDELSESALKQRADEIEFCEVLIIL